MPSLPSAMAGQAQEAAESSGSFDALEPGVYTARLAKVDVTQTAQTKNPMWNLEFDQVQDLQGAKKPGRLWTNLVIIDSVMWKVGQFFAAYGVPTTTDTDELINYRCRLQVDKRVITQGKRAGQEGNEITGFSILKDGDQGFEHVSKLAAKSGGAKPAPAAKQSPAAAPAAAAAAPAAGGVWDGPGPESGGVEF